MKTSLDGKKFLAAREACCTVPYEDGIDEETGEIIRWSIGYGVLAPLGADTPPITLEEGWATLGERIVRYEADVNRHLGDTTLTQPMFDALVSLYWNTGAGKKKPLIALIKAGDVLGAADLLLTYDKVKGVPSAAHRGRRSKEREVFLRGRYGDLTSMLVWTVDPRAHPKAYVPHPMPAE